MNKVNGHIRFKLADERASLEMNQEAAEVLRAIGEKDAKAILANLADNLALTDRDATKELLEGLLEKVELCPASLNARLHYHFAAGDLVASPRGFEPRLPP